MSRRPRRAPHRQPRGPRATLPPLPPRAPMPDPYSYWDSESACEDCGHWLDECRCPVDGPS